MIELLKWDSDFFGIKVGRATLRIPAEAKTISAEAAGYDVVYLFADPDDEALAQQIREAIPGAFLADTKVTYLKAVEPDKHSAPESSIVSAYSSSPELESLAIQSGIYSRFRTDARFGTARFEALYRTWIHKSISRELAEDVFVAMHEGKPAGLVTVGEKNGRADIGLIAVDEAARGQRLGTRLVQHAEHHAAVTGRRNLQVVTQGENLEACAFYEHCGFHRAEAIAVYHFWPPSSHQQPLQPS